MTDNSFLQDKEFVVETILKILPEVKIVAFGSRVKGTAKKYSDLDIALFSSEKISLSDLSKLSELFSESDLEYRVDIVDGSRIDLEFKELIEQTAVVWKN